MAKLDAAIDLIGFGEDYHAWVLEQIELLKAGRFADLDVEHLADELKSLVTSEQQEIDSRLTVLLQHLLKWEFQPARRSNSWRATILEQRFRINRVIQRSPSLRRYPATVLEQEYLLARLRAADQTGITLDKFPPSCPYTAAEALDEKFWPGGGADFEG
jgi:Domain of unknown function DUF29